MASLKSCVLPSAVTSCEESSVVLVIDSNERLVPPISTEAVAGCSYAALPSASPLDGDDDFVHILIDVDGVEPPPHTPGSSGRNPTMNVKQIRSQWSMSRLLTTLGTEEQCIQFAEEQGLVLKEKQCSYHKIPMKLRTGGNCGKFGRFHCTKSNCRSKAESRAIGTWFEFGKISILRIFEIMYMFSHKFTHLQVQIETAREGEPILSTSTIADWFSYCQETIVIYELKHNEARSKIGGPGKVVQLGESKFGEKTYNKERFIGDTWVLGMIEDGSDDLRLEVCPNKERSAEILVPLIQKHVEEGTEIHTDSWNGYDCLTQYGYIHKKVNHKFGAPKGTHTQRIKSHWRHLKMMYNEDQCKSDFSDWLIEYNWRRKIRKEFKDPFIELVKAIKYVYKIY